MGRSPGHGARRHASPGAAAERARVARHVAGELAQRGLELTGAETTDDLVMLLEAADRFDAVRRARGGDSFTNTPMSSRPDEPALVIPARRPSDSAELYAGRIRGAAARLGARAD